MLKVVARPWRAPRGEQRAGRPLKDGTAKCAWMPLLLELHVPLCCCPRTDPFFCYSTRPLLKPCLLPGRPPLQCCLCPSLLDPVWGSTCTWRRGNAPKPPPHAPHPRLSRSQPSSSSHSCIPAAQRARWVMCEARRRALCQPCSRIFSNIAAVEERTSSAKHSLFHLHSVAGRRKKGHKNDISF